MTRPESQRFVKHIIRHFLRISAVRATHAKPKASRGCCFDNTNRIGSVMFKKIFGGIIAASIVLVALRLCGVTLSLQSPLLLAEFCGLLAVVASFVALFGAEDRADRGVEPQRTAMTSARAAQPPRWQSM
jgi:hypothetical protein